MHTGIPKWSRSKLQSKKEEEKPNEIFNWNHFNEEVENMHRRVAFRERHAAAGINAVEYVKISMGGRTYSIRNDLYIKERTRMHDIVEGTHEQRLLLVDGYDPTSNEYYLERNSRVADHIMDFFATGSLHKPTNVCTERFKEELAYWKIGREYVSTCCALPFDSSSKTHVQDDEFNQDELIAIFDGAVFSNFRMNCWKFLEDPQSSIPAAIFALFSICFVFASVIGLILGSMPEFQEDSTNATAYHYMHAKHRANEGNKFSNSFETNEMFPDFVYKPTDSPHYLLIYLEYVCMAWFSLEYFTRLLIYPKRKEFITRTLNIIDLLTILPFYLEFCLPLIGMEANFNKLTGAILVFRLLRVLRMARLFKLARYSTSLQTFGHTLKASMTELSMLSLFLVTGIIFFSTIMYYLEKDEPYTDFYSIPAACWWCVVTMATVGYGDAKPVTTIGKLAASTAAILGIIVLAFPISMIVEKFSSAQQKAIEEQQLQAARMSAVANNMLLRRFPTRRRIRRNRQSSSGANEPLTQP